MTTTRPTRWPALAFEGCLNHLAFWEDLEYNVRLQFNLHRKVSDISTGTIAHAISRSTLLMNSSWDKALRTVLHTVVIVLTSRESPPQRGTQCYKISTGLNLFPGDVVRARLWAIWPSIVSRRLLTYVPQAHPDNIIKYLPLVTTTHVRTRCIKLSILAEAHMWIISMEPSDTSLGCIRAPPYRTGRLGSQFVCVSSPCGLPSLHFCSSPCPVPHRARFV